MRLVMRCIEMKMVCLVVANNQTCRVMLTHDAEQVDETIQATTSSNESDPAPAQKTREPTTHPLRHQKTILPQNTTHQLDPTLHLPAAHP